MNYVLFNPAEYAPCWVQSGEDVCARIRDTFLTPNIAKYVIRTTGGCDNMEEPHRSFLPEVRKALRGFWGVGISGATQSLYCYDPTRVLDTVTEVFSAIPGIRELQRIQKDPNQEEILKHRFPGCSRAMLKIGIAAYTETRFLTPYGVCVANNHPQSFSILRTDCDYNLSLQCSTNRNFKVPRDSLSDKGCGSPWDAEFLEAIDMIESLHSYGWGSLLLVFNGGSVTKREIIAWANEGWNVLLIRGSG